MILVLRYIQISFCDDRFTYYKNFLIVTEQNGNDRRPSAWNCSQKQVIMPPSKDCTELLRMAVGTHLNLAPVQQPPVLLTFTTDKPLLQQLSPSRNRFHIVSTLPAWPHLGFRAPVPISVLWLPVVPSVHSPVITQARQQLKGLDLDRLVPWRRLWIRAHQLQLGRGHLVTMKTPFTCKYLETVQGLINIVISEKCIIAGTCFNLFLLLNVV